MIKAENLCKRYDDLTVLDNLNLHIPRGTFCMITGASGSGKSTLLRQLAASIVSKKPFLLWQTKSVQGKVLYINLEVESASLFHRFRSIYYANGWEFTENCHNICPWNLRGYAVPLDKLAAKIIRRCKNTGPYKAIILDPLYKVQQGDENSAEAISVFCNALDRIAHETGAAIIYDHHHPKGSAGERKVIDRGSGSGVFSRDADAICDLSFLDPDTTVLKTIGQQLADGEKPMQIAFVLRDFKDIEPINIWFNFPLHFIDSADLLKGVPLEGSREANLQKSEKRQMGASWQERLEDIYVNNEENGEAKLSDMADWCAGSPVKRTLERWIAKSPDFTLSQGIVRRSK